MSYEPQIRQTCHWCFKPGLICSYAIGYELLRVLLPPPRGNFVDYVFHKGYHLRSFMEYVSLLAAGAFGCYSVLITLPVIFLNTKLCN